MHKYISLIALFFLSASCQDFHSAQENNAQHARLTGDKHHATTSKELDQLFAQLKVANNSQVIRRTQNRIRALWTDHADADIDTLMQKGTQAMYSKDYERAIALFGQVIQQKPYFAEGWNKRATVYFVKGNYQASLDDIRETLKLEERHFGALSGMASIYMMRGETSHALQTYQQIHELIPQLREVNKSIEELQAYLGYRQI